MTMTEMSIRCPICGTENKEEANTCEKCRTRLSQRSDGSLSVKSPKSKGKTHIMIDIEDPLTRKKLEELTLIPGVSRKKALLLYQSGIHSIEEFMEKAFHGERFSVNYSRTVSNKLLVQSLKNMDDGKKTDILCPSCNAPNPLTAIRCKVCNFDIESDMKNVSMTEISGKINDSVKEILDTLKKSEDFELLPEDMKQQFAALVESDDVDFEMDKPKELESLGIDLDKIDEGMESMAEPGEKAATVAADDGAEPGDAKAREDEDNIPEPDNPKKADVPAAANKSTEKQEKIRKILTEKLVKWRKSGYDVDPLEEYLDDVEGFKLKAKEVLAQGKVIKQRFLKQLEMWKEKGFDVSELEPILEKDVDLFSEKAKELLKKQNKNK